MSFKIHLYKKLSNGKLNANKTECGKYLSWSNDGGAKHAYKTNQFQEAVKNHKESLCINCLANGKATGRIND